jgi:hypothetical protein
MTDTAAVIDALERAPSILVPLVREVLELCGQSEYES